MLGRSDQARAAYGEAIALYKQVDYHFGRAQCATRARRPELSQKPERSRALFL
jgi:hypothetical protein